MRAVAQHAAQHGRGGRQGASAGRSGTSTGLRLARPTRWNRRAASRQGMQSARMGRAQPGPHLVSVYMRAEMLP